MRREHDSAHHYIWFLGGNLDDLPGIAPRIAKESDLPVVDRERVSSTRQNSPQSTARSIRRSSMMGVPRLAAISLLAIRTSGSLNMRRKNIDARSTDYERLEVRSMLSADGIVVADYRDDFNNADSFWSYGFNTSESLTELEVEPFEGDLVLTPGQATGDTGAIRFTPTGGHPGVSSNRYAIASWTVNESGYYSLTDTFLTVPSFDFQGADGVEFRVFVNDSQPIDQGVVEVDQIGYFDIKVGHLNRGDIVRVAFGANGNHAFDRFETDFSIRIHPELSQVNANFLETVDQSIDTDSRNREAEGSWRLLWNAPDGWSEDQAGNQRTGSIDDVDSYLPLTRASDRMLNPLGSDDFSNAPQYFLRFDSVGGHVGVGFQNDSAFQDRYVIAASTIQRSGRYSLTDTFLETNGRSNDGVELRVFVNDPENELIRKTVSADEAASFDLDFETLNRGDTVFVAFGPGDNHIGDRFRTDFSLVRELPRAEPLRIIDTEQVLFARDYGAIPNDRTSDVAGLLEAIGIAGRSSVPTKIVLEKGIYNFYSSDLTTIGNPRYFFTLARLGDVEIDGQGATLVVENNDRGLFRIFESENVILRNLTIDYAQLFQTAANPADDIYRVNTHSQGRVISIDPNTSSFVFEADSAASVEPDHSFVKGNTAGVQAWGYVLEGENESRLKYNSRWHYATLGLEKVGNRLYRVTVDDMHNIAPGDRYVLARRTNVGTIGVFADSNQVSIIDVTIHASPSAFVTAKESTLVNIIRSKAEILESAGRWRSINADAVHGQSLRQGFWVEDSSFDAVGDDIMNFYSVPTVVVGKPASNQLTLANVVQDSLRSISEHLWHVGDVATFVDPVSGETIAESRVESIESVEFGHPDFGTLSTQTLTFSEPINGIRFASGKGVNDEFGFRNDTAVYNSSTSQGFLVQGTTLSNARRYGQFLMADNVQLVDNTYSNLSDSAIKGSNESNWPIGLYTENVLVQNNRFNRNGFSQRFFAEDYLAGVVAFNMDRLGHEFVKGPQYELSRIEIIDNIFRGWGKTAIAAKNVSGLRIEGNRIFSPLGFPDNTGRRWYAVDVEFNRDVNVAENELLSGVDFIKNANNVSIQIAEVD